MLAIAKKFKIFRNFEMMPRLFKSAHDDTIRFGPYRPAE
jgi:hypothetical protein